MVTCTTTTSGQVTKRGRPHFLQGTRSWKACGKALMQVLKSPKATSTGPDTDKHARETNARREKCGLKAFLIQPSFTEVLLLTKSAQQICSNAKNSLQLLVYSLS